MMARFAVIMDTERLDRLIVLAGVTPTQLAEDAGVGQATISRARARRPLTPASWLRIAATLARYPANPELEALLSQRKWAARGLVVSEWRLAPRAGGTSIMHNVGPAGRD